MSIEARAREIAAKKAGIREDQVETAVAAYREAVNEQHDEPQWQAVMHILGMCVCQAEGTQVQMEFHSATKSAPSRKIYVYRHTVYETFGEARASELRDEAKFEIRPV